MIKSVDVDTLFNENKYWIGTSYIDDQTWVLYTDYGTYGYHWHSIGEGYTLKKFITKCSPEYLVHKLIDHKELEVIDWDGTKNAIIKYILESRRSKDISSEEARDLLDNIKYVEHEDEYAHSSEPIDDWWEYIVRKPTHVYENWTKMIIPGFQKMFKDQLAKEYLNSSMYELTAGL